MMKNIIIIGSGAVASEITSYLDDINDVQIKGYLEYSYNLEKYYNVYNYKSPVIGTIEDYQPQDDDLFIIGVSHIGFRERIIETMKSKGAKFYTLIHPTAIIAKDAVIGEGCVISPFCMIGPRAIVGSFNELTSYSFISHDCVIGTNNSFSTAGVWGRSHIGNNNTFYIRSTVQPDLTIGNNCVVQAGMVVDKDMPDGTTMFYRFKEKVMAIPKQD